jgi:2-oxo-4-hydroxy-4-carboxy-5-ureidoimidazoline decarboxylase
MSEMVRSTNEVLEAWNNDEEEQVLRAILPCNGSPAWAIALVRQRPFTNAADLFRASDEVWRSLSEQEWQQAFDSHPRIGEKKAKAASEQSAKWSAGEQQSAQADEALQAALTVGNKEYEANFGRIFLICATGKSAAEILEALQQRMGNDAATELQEAVEQQRRITQLRLRKWLGMPAENCEAV